MKRSRSRKSEVGDEPIAQGAVAPDELEAAFPAVDLPIQPPFPPMEARSVTRIPEGSEYQYEPKWDGFRCLAFRSKDGVVLQSKAGQPLGRYFPELVEALSRLRVREFVLDGEIVILREGRLSFDDLLQRIHPAASRIRRLSIETPATFLVFDLLVDSSGRSLLDLPLRDRRSRLEELFADLKQEATVRLSPQTRDYGVALRWFEQLAATGFDGVVAKETNQSYASGERSAMVKVKRLRTADCVVGGFRYAAKGGEVGSLLLGLYNDSGALDHVGFTSSFSVEERKTLKKILKSHEGSGFSGKAPGGPSRWSTERSGEWEPLDCRLVCEVRYDHFSGGRFRHGTKFLRWRPDKAPQTCTFDQLQRSGNIEAISELLAA